jgi:hypothetical protein
MGTLSRIGHPSFFTSSLMATSPPTRGAGTGEPQQRLRVDASFHQFRSPFKKRTGVFWRAGRGPEWNAPTRRAEVNSGNARTGTSSTRNQPCRTHSARLRFRRGFAAGRAALGDSTALFIPMLENSPNPRDSAVFGSYDHCATIGRRRPQNYCVEVVHDHAS